MIVQNSNRRISIVLWDPNTQPNWMEITGAIRYTKCFSPEFHEIKTNTDKHGVVIAEPFEMVGNTAESIYQDYIKNQPIGVVWVNTSDDYI